MAVNLVAVAKRGKASPAVRGAALFLALATVIAGSLPGSALALTAAEVSAARTIMADVDRGKWDDAHGAASRAHSTMLTKLVEWFFLTQPGTPASFDEITRFIDANRDWPSQGTLKRHAEDAIDDSTPAQKIAAWFTQAPPQTSVGAGRYIDALSGSGRKSEAEATARQFLVDGTMTDAQLSQYASRFGAMLRPADFQLRADRLAWDGDTDGASQVLTFLTPEARSIIQTRIAFANQSSNAPVMLSHLSVAQQGDLGILYERMRWLRRQNRDAEAIALLGEAPPSLPHADLWWNERAILARRALSDNNAKTAYQLARDHRQAEGAALADGEWLAGWIALRFLNDPQSAAQHFQMMLSKVDKPISVARAAYWAARAEDAQGNAEAAKPFYTKASVQIGTFYGQLALAKISPGARIVLPKQPSASGLDSRVFNNRELVQVAEVLNTIGMATRADPFVRRIGELARTPDDALLAMRLAKVTRSLAAEVLVAKKLMQGGMPLLADGYPVLAPMPRAPESPLIHAIIRQESLFDGSAVSPSGALGLMQLMPGTAKGVADKLKMRKYRLALLTTDPRSNVVLGSAYLDDLVDRFGGSYIFAIAAYNAGPGRVAGWVRDNGDPRHKLEDTVDWIEKIGVGETRNYVQRVMENLEIYRAIIGRGSAPNLIEKDLLR